MTTRTWPSERGRLDAAAALAMAVPDGGPYLVSTAAFAVENTHNFGGGTVQPIGELRALREGADALGIAVHLDGARLWNAHVATGVPLAEYGGVADTVSVCLSKGLGAPVGSVLVGSAERIAAARVWRKRYGGGMRQVGILAAAGRYALDRQLDRLADDHARARRLAEAVAGVRPELVDTGAVETNIVVLDLAAAGLPRPTSPPPPESRASCSRCSAPVRSAWSPTSTSTTTAASTPHRSSRRCWADRTRRPAHRPPDGRMTRWRSYGGTPTGSCLRASGRPTASGCGTTARYRGSAR